MFSVKEDLFTKTLYLFIYEFNKRYNSKYVSLVEDIIIFLKILKMRAISERIVKLVYLL